jgi:hypothetical protein
MTRNKQGASQAEERADLDLDGLDPALKQALGDFKASVRTWSDAAYSQPRRVEVKAARKLWKLASSWGLAAVLLASGISGGAYLHHERALQAQVAAKRAAEQQAALQAEQAQQEEKILASVDSAVSREIPKAMEPLAQLSEEEESQ